MSQPALAKYKPVEWKPGVQYQSDEELARLAGDIATTIFHPVGTTKMGAAGDPMAVAPLQLIRGGKSIEGWAGVTPADSEDTLRFADLRGVRAMIETYPLEKAAEAYARMMSGKAEFRAVLTM